MNQEEAQRCRFQHHRAPDRDDDSGSMSRRSGMFEYVAVWSARAAKANPAGILFLLQISTAVFSAFSTTSPPCC